MKVYDELVEFLAACNPRALIQFQPSAAARDRLWRLLEAEKHGQLSEDDRDELDCAMHLEHLMRLAKARAHGFLAQEK